MKNILLYYKEQKFKILFMNLKLCNKNTSYQINFNNIK